MAESDDRRPWRVRYRVGLGVLVSLLLAATVAVIGWATFSNTRAGIVELTSERIRDLLRGLEARVRSHLESAATAAELSARLVAERAVADDPDSLAHAFTQVLRAHPAFSWASYSDEAGNFVGAYRNPAGELHVSRTSVRDGGKSDDYPVAADGSWQPPAHLDNYAYDPRDELFYKRAKEAKAPVWIGPVIFFDEGVPGITYAVPRVAAGGAVRGVFTVDFNLNLLSEFAKTLRFGAHGEVFVLDAGAGAADPSVVAYPTLRVREVTGQGAKGALVTVAQVNDPALSGFVAAMAARAAGEAPAGTPPPEEQFAFDAGGGRYLGGYRILRVERGPAWALGALTLESDFLGVLDRNRAAMLAIAAAALGVGLLLALLLARRISVPLMRLASEMEEAGRFELADRPRMRTVFREVAAMDEALLRMKGSLRSFAYYVPKDLVRSLLASGEEAALRGEVREMTVFFADVAGMTSLAESATPNELIAHLGAYFEEMTRVVREHGGTVDKFIGDGVMSFWGAPAPSADHAARACECALAAQRRLAALRLDAVPAGRPPLDVRIGIATGEVIVGNIGSPERFNYTVMGDAANLASRLEGLNKAYGTSILVGDATLRAAHASVVARPVDLVRVVGREEPVRVWEPLCLATEDDPAARELARLFSEGLAAYLARDFQGAARRYEQALSLRPGDRPAAVLLRRCCAFAEAPPPPSWDGVHDAPSK